LETLISINSKKSFSLNEAKQLLPLIYRITEVSQLEVKRISNQLDAIKEVNSERASAFERQINDEVSKWQEKVQKLGAVAKGLWLVDFDNGDGYFCWKFPESDIRFWHGYQDGYSSRVEL
jgi:hypothetical protein